MLAVGGDQHQYAMSQLSRLLGRPRCFSGREDEWHEWTLKFGATAATLSNGPGSGADFRATMYTLSHSSV